MNFFKYNIKFPWSKGKADAAERNDISPEISRPALPTRDGLGAIPEAWLFDAPLFIDDHLIKSLYNAVALPELETDGLEISTEDVKVSKWTAEGQVEVSAGESIFSKIFVPISAKATVKGSHGKDTTKRAGAKWKFTPVDAPEGRLVNLAIHYVVNLKDYVWSLDGRADAPGLKRMSEKNPSPKPLIFMDIDPGCPIMPMAAEQSDGKIVTFYDKLTAAVADKVPGEPLPPPYPPGDTGPDAVTFWSWLHTAKPGGRDTSSLLLEVIENTVGNAGRLQWINCRIPIDSAGEEAVSLHLHFKCRGLYDTGDFGYHFIHRGNITASALSEHCSLALR
jgi:hypothetical protein